MPTDSIGQEFRQGTVGTAYLSSRMSGASAGNIQRLWPESSGGVFTHISGGCCWLSPGTSVGTVNRNTPLCGTPGGLSVWASLGSLRAWWGGSKRARGKCIASL